MKTNNCGTTHNKLLQQLTPNVSQTQNSKLTQKIQISEIKEAIYSTENGKSPGIDSLPIEFYKDFFELLKDNLQNTNKNFSKSNNKTHYITGTKLLNTRKKYI